MESKLERAIIRTFRKIRDIEISVKSMAEIAGIFINFCYTEYGVHAGLQTRDINIIKNINDIWIIQYVYKPDKWSPILSQELYKELSIVTESEFYSMWLRASFEDPKNDSWNDPIVRNAFKDFKSLDHPLFTHVQYPKDPFGTTNIEADIHRIRTDVENQISDLKNKAVFTKVADEELDKMCKEADRKLMKMGLSIFTREGDEGSIHY